MEKISKQQVAQNMGETTSKVFAGETQSETTKQMYTETPAFFAQAIRERLKLEKEYTIADIGSSRGEMLQKCKELLSDYSIKTIAIDLDSKALEENIADTKIIGSAENMPIEKVDVALMRYVLQWNTPERQQKILKEISRVIREFAIIEHIGADSLESDKWRDHMDDLLDGEEIQKLKRGEHYFSSKTEIEQWMSNQGIRFQELRNRRIEDAVNTYVERYNLSEIETLLAQNILGSKNYFYQTDWIILPEKLED